MRELQFEIILKKVEEGKYHAICPSLPGCISEGKTKKEALVKIEKAILDYIEMALDWTASGMMMLRVFGENEKEPSGQHKLPQMFPMEVKLYEDNKLLESPDPSLPEKGVLGIPFGFN
jgi:predicted RNase H-like HicB family nuclease